MAQDQKQVRRFDIFRFCSNSFPLSPPFSPALQQSKPIKHACLNLTSFFSLSLSDNSPTLEKKGKRGGGRRRKREWGGCHPAPPPPVTDANKACASETEQTKNVELGLALFKRMGTERGGSTDPPPKKTNSLVCLFSPPLFCVHSPSTLFHFPLMSLSSFLPPSISFNEEEKGKSLATWKGRSPIHRPPKSETHTLFPLSFVSPSSSAATYYSEKWAGIKKEVCLSLVVSPSVGPSPKARLQDVAHWPASISLSPLLAAFLA